MDFEALGLLEGLEGNERAGREQLLARLVREGFSSDQLIAAVREDRLALLAVDRVLGGTHTATDVQLQTGLPAALMIRIRRLQGLPQPGPEDRVFTDEDIAAARSIKLFMDAGFDDDALAEITRVLAEGMDRLAATTTAAFVRTFLAAGDSEADVALRFESLARELTPALAPVLLAAFKAHLRESVARGVIGRAEREAGELRGAQETVVCFADLVGFTRLGGRVELQELGSVAVTLARLAAEATKPPVRLVKTIGDAAMFVSPDARPLISVALALVDAVEQADLPSLRAGIAIGPALLSAGDYYGHSVNLASRVTGIARPGSVLCTQDVRDAAPGAAEWSSAGNHKLKGISEPVALFRARPLAAAPDSGSAPASEREQRSGNDRRDTNPKQPRAGRLRRRASS
jgi:adenylate cyclase